MKLHLLSDLHAEFYPDEFPVERYIQPADVLVLAGDIHVGFADTNQLVSRFAEHYEHVLYVPGNHEHYRRNLQEFDYKEFDAENAINLNPGFTIINGVKFVGATLWTNFRGNPLSELIAKSRIQDFRYFTTDQVINRFYRDLEFLEDNKADVYITHFPPYKECVHPRYKNDALNDYFINDINLRPAGAVWLFGHTHAAMSLQVDGVRLYSNPLGYLGESMPKYHPLVIEV